MAEGIAAAVESITMTDNTELTPDDRLNLITRNLQVRLMPSEKISWCEPGDTCHHLGLFLLLFSSIEICDRDFLWEPVL